MSASQLLVASPQMRDPFFERAVVLLWEHTEDGAMGVVINRELGHFLPDVLDGVDDLDLTPYTHTAVGWGGPVELGHGTVVTRGQVGSLEGRSLDGDIAVTWSQDALTRLIGERAPILLCLGYAGWGPMQLDGEIEQGAWIWAETRPEILFEAPMAERYERALATVGLSPHTVWRPPADA